MSYTDKELFLIESALIEGHDIDKTYLDTIESRVKSNGEAAYTFLENSCTETGGVLSESVLLQAHGLLMDGLSPANAVGAYRTINVMVGPFVPPKAEFVPIMMDYFIQEFNKTNKPTWDYHAWFETIHPFCDGNGRIGRLLWMYDLSRRGQSVYPILNTFITETITSFEDKRRAYYNNLQSYRVIDNSEV